MLTAILGRIAMNKIYFTRGHKIIEIISYVLLAVSFILVIIAQKTLPAKIPVHYNAAGRATGYGSPATLFLMPIIILFSNLMISFITHFVSVDFWNTPFKVNEEKKILVYRDIVSMMLWMELEIAVFNLVFTIMSCLQKMGGALFLSILLMVLFTVTIIVFCILAARHNESR